MAKTLDELHREKTGKISDKWASYLPYYDSRFNCLRDSPITLLEIGVQNGGSLETWAAYFSNAIEIIGCDIERKCGLLEFEDPRIKVVVGDANEAVTLKSISELADFKKLIDVLGYEFWKNEVSLASHFATFFPDGHLPKIIADGWVDAIEFRNSIIAVRKATVSGHEKLGERLICGQVGLATIS